MRSKPSRLIREILACAVFGLVLFAVNAAAFGQNTVDEILSAVVRVQTEINPSGRTATVLGMKRDGHGVVIDSSGLVLTIGYLILESRKVIVTGSDGATYPARFVAYDSDTGFGLVRTQTPLKVKPMRLGDSGRLAEGTGVIVAGFGGRGNMIRATVVARRDFAGYWEYLLPKAIFTQPPFNVFGGAALIDQEGRLVGIGSLLVGDAKQGGGVSPGNMFVPINALKPILGTMIESGRSDAPPRPWVGIYSEEMRQRIFVTRLAAEGPGAAAGVEIGDIVVAVGGKPVAGMNDFYRKLWALGAPGIDVPLTVLRLSGKLETLTLRSRDRYDWYRYGTGN